MGRFYKTTSSHPIDYMYRINSPLMEKVIESNDKAIGENLGQLDQLNTAANSFAYLQPDEERANQIMQDYTSKIDSVAAAIRDDPANWRKQLDPIRGVGRELLTNFKTGEISKIAGNYNIYKKVSDEIDKSVEEYNKTGKGIDATRGARYKQSFLENFIKKNPKGTAYDPSSRSYNLMKAEVPMANIDIRKRLSEEMDKIKSDENTSVAEDLIAGGAYFNKVTRSWEGVSPQKILSIAMSRLNDPQLLNYMRQDSKVGLMKGVFNEDGSFINPYTHEAVPISPEERAELNNRLIAVSKVKDPNKRQAMRDQLLADESKLLERTALKWNSESSLSPTLQGIMQEYSHTKVKNENDLSNNSLFNEMQNINATNKRDALNRGSREAIAKMQEDGRNSRFNDKLDFDKYKWDHPHTPGSKTKTGKETVPPVETDVSKLSNNPFANWNTTTSTGESVPVLSNQGLSFDIDNKKKVVEDTKGQIQTLDKTMKGLIGNRSFEDLNPAEQNAYSQMMVKYNQLNKDLPKVMSELDERRKYYNLSTEAALSNNPNAGETVLTKQEVELYNQWANDREGTKHYQEMLKVKPRVTSDPDIIKEDAAQGKTDKYLSLKKPYDAYMAVKKKVDEKRNTFLQNVRTNPVVGDAINLNEADSKAVGNIIFSNTQGYRLYDQNGKPTSGELDGNGISLFNRDNTKFTFTGNQLSNYIKDNKVKVHVEQAANGIRLGTGNAVVKVSFEDPNGEIDKRPYYIELTPEMQRTIGSKFLNHKNPEVAKIASNMLDDEGNYIRKQLITPNPNRVNSEGVNNFDPIETTIYLRNGDQQVPIYVTKFISADGVDHLNMQMMKDGKLVPVPLNPNLPNSGIPGWFKNDEDFIRQYFNRK